MSTIKNVTPEDSTVSDIDIIRCILYCVQGVNSNLITFNEIENQFNIIANLNPVQNMKVKRLLEIGYLHHIIKTYIEKNSNNQNGAIATGISHCLRKELYPYYDSINQLLNEVNESYNNSKHYSFGNLLCWSILWLRNLQDLASTVNMIDNLNGIKIISTIVPFAWCGNPYLKQMAENMVKLATRPILISMCHWMIDGELKDSYNEFFIFQCTDNNYDNIWINKYKIRESMIPIFFTKNDVNKIYHTGRYINFLHDICKIRADITPTRQMLIDLRNSGDKDLYPMLEKNSVISDIINKACTESSTVVLDILKHKFNLFLHFEGLRRYMLLGQGDFVTSLLEILQLQLDKCSSIENKHSFRNYLDIATKMSNAQYDNPVILKTLDVKLLLTSGEDTSWDIFQLDYSTGGPLETIFEFSGSGKYSIMFAFLWRLKRIDFILSKMWRELNLLIKISYFIIPEIRYALKLTNNLVNEMNHTIRQIQFYVLSDVIETEWDYFQKSISDASLLETVIDSHNQFLKNIFKRSMQTEATHELSKKMRQLFESVLELQGIEELFYNQFSYELKRRKDLEQYIDDYGTNIKIEQNDKDIKSKFLLEVDRYENIIKEIRNSFKIDLGKFLKKLIKVSSEDQEALHSLANRINSNHFYSN